MPYEQTWGDWSHPNPGQYLRNDGVEVLRTAARTWTLTWPWHGEESRYRTARAAMSYADHAN